MDLKATLKKVGEDFLGALPFWREHFDEWIFTHNDSSGLAADVLKLLLELSGNNKPLIATHWGYPELLTEFKRLSDSDVGSLLGPGLVLNDVVSVGVVEVRQLLEHIALLPEPLITEVKPVPPEKLEYNQLSSGAETLLRVGMTKAEVVRKYLRGLVDQTRHDRVAAAFRKRYEELKAEGRAPDDIFAGLQKFVAGDSIPSPSHQAASFAILAFLFEECEIFERPLTSNIRE